jgi:UDP-glucose 4-epimerase
MQVLITGGAGFIGSHTVATARSAGLAVRVLDDLSTGRRENIPADVELVVGDVADPECVRQAVAGCDAVVHLAALVSVPQSLGAPAETFRINTFGTAQLLEAARQAHVRRFVLASTCAVYGNLPGRQDEGAPTAPLVPYAASKLMAEQWVQVYTRAFGVEGVILRYFNVYGPRQRADSPYSGVLARWCAAVAAGEPCRVFGDGAQTRDFVSVHDVARANLMAANGADWAWGGVYNVATGASSSLNEVLAALDSVAPGRVMRRYEAGRAGDILHSAGDSSRLQKAGWRPTVTLEEGLREVLATQVTRDS